MSVIGSAATLLIDLFVPPGASERTKHIINLRFKILGFPAGAAILLGFVVLNISNDDFGFWGIVQTAIFVIGAYFLFRDAKNSLGDLEAYLLEHGNE